MRILSYLAILLFVIQIFLTISLPVWAENMLISPTPEGTILIGLTSPVPPKEHPQRKILETSAMGEILAAYNSIEDLSVTPTPTLAHNPKVKSQKSISGHYTIAVLGDSMVDVMQPGLPQLANLLNRTYPKATFTLYNFGVGASNLEYAINRLTNGYTYLGEGKPAILSTHPDIVVIESFAYNNFGPEQSGLDHQWLSLAKLVDIIRANSPGSKIIIGATIAPNGSIFGDQAGLNFAPADKWQRAETIKKYLENAVRFGKSQNLPVADAYHASLNSDGQGKKRLIQDGIHPSGPGGELFARKIVEAISRHKLLEK